MNTMFVKNFIFYFIVTYMIGLLIVCFYTFIKNYTSSSKDGFTQMDYDINIINGSNSRSSNSLNFNSAKKPSNLSFDNVIGLNSVKKELRYYLDFIKNREKYLKHDVKLPKGVLLVGPPGTGKTLLVKALASEASIDLLQTSGSEFVEVYVGVGAARIRKLFENARSKKNCIIFIDEIDAVGRKRSDVNRDNSERDNTLNQLLVEMDGFNASSNIIVFAATNIVKTLDPALLRSGRFDKKVIFDAPNVDERKQMFELYLNSIKINKEVDTQDLAKRASGLTGADIANVANQAKILAIRRVTESKNNKNAEIILTNDDINKAIDEVMIGMEKRERQMTDEEKTIVSHHEAGHALMGYLLKNSSPPIKVSIIPRGEAALGFSQPEPKDQKLYKYVDLFDQICVFLGGRVAEEVIFNSITTGASDDIERLTKIAYGMVVRYGMVEELGAVNYTDVTEVSDEIKSKIDNKVKEIVSSAYDRTREILKKHESDIRKLAEKLLESETLLLNDIETLIDPKLRDSISNENLMFSSKTSNEEVHSGKAMTLESIKEVELDDN
ncbi:Peptidase family M41 [seawater metagenome]|uniref:Peptidase family M41 n=1 Tax=seawater metagenome TaxID=1561972 RepID=A0A5E8CLE3_9ZZZZ